ncbi:MAG: hypothetical protein K0S09_1164 [Sphingobacteriaceae bacterium]|jgi:hypothetical protein|nr:hypothetical protein [Sphingobacteriaceae bacterium]
MMNRVNEPFEIKVDLNNTGETVSLQVRHQEETFDFSLNGTDVSILNNGDNSWSGVSNAPSQELVNRIGAEIEKHFRGLPA